MGAHCNVIEPDGSLRQNQLNRPAIRSLLFPVEQARLLDTWNTIGLRGTASDSYAVDDIFVPETFSGTREDPSLRRDPGRLYAFPMQGIYAVGVSGVALGTARAMLDAFLQLARDKTPRGQKRLADSPVVQSELARNEAKLGAAHAYLATTLQDIWHTVIGNEIISVPDRGRVRLASSPAPPSNAASAISTPSCNKSRAAPPTSKPSARSSSGMMSGCFTEQEAWALPKPAKGQKAL
jgi:alkylation response protein AidB-like acyl-CoA dehydrogenase